MPGSLRSVVSGSAQLDALERHLARMDPSTPTNGKTGETMNDSVGPPDRARTCSTSRGVVQSVQVSTRSETSCGVGRALDGGLARARRGSRWWARFHDGPPGRRELDARPDPDSLPPRSRWKPWRSPALRGGISLKLAATNRWSGPL